MTRKISNLEEGGKEMFHIYKNGDNIDSKVVEYVADTEADIANLPTNHAPGSICLVLQSSDGGATAYALGTDHEWHIL